MVSLKARPKEHVAKPADLAPHVAGGMAQHIARVAARLFAAQGYDATPVRTIVEAAGITKPTLYYHFGSKEGLAQALLTVPLTHLTEALQAMLDAGEDPRETAAKVIEAHFAFVREDPDRGRFVFALYFGPLGSSLAGELARFSEALTACWDRLGRSLAGAGTIAPERAAACAANLRGVMVVHTLDYLYRGGVLAPELAPRLVDDMLYGFAVEGGGRG
jgi:AcrR family transcriptional regulator